MSSLLKVERVGKNYSGFHALRDVSFEVKQGETFAIIGPNGAGKTTLFKVMTGEVPASTGWISLSGKDITQTSADERVRLGIGRTFQIVRVFPEFSLMQNLVVAIESRNRNAGLRGGLRVSPRSEVIEQAYHRLSSFGLAKAAASEARHLSLGDRKRLELAMTLAMEPLVLMMDEPTAGMSPPERIAIIDLIQRVREEMRLTILLTEHDMDFVFQLAQTLMVMNQGQKILDGVPEIVARSETVQEIYLGKEMVNA